MNDLSDLKDEFEALFDLDDPFDREAHDDLDALEVHDTFELYERHRKRDGAIRAKLDMDMDARIRREVDYLNARRLAAAAEGDEAEKEPKTPEQRRAAVCELEEILRQGVDEDRAAQRRTWARRHNLLCRRRAIEKRLARHGRGPPGG